MSLTFIWMLFTTIALGFDLGIDFRATQSTFASELLTIAQIAFSVWAACSYLHEQKKAQKA